MKTLFIAVDMQKDFMDQDGKLYVQGSEEIKPNIKKLVQWVTQNSDNILAYTRDIHKPGDPELSDTPDFINTFPPHCMSSTPGANNIPESFGVSDMSETMPGSCSIISFVKNVFNIFEANDEFLKYLTSLKYIDNIYIAGVAGDKCVSYAIDGLFEHKGKEFDFKTMYVVEDCIAAIDPKAFDLYLTRLVAKHVDYNCIQITNTNAIINDTHSNVYIH